MSTQFAIREAEMKHLPLLAAVHAESFGASAWAIPVIQSSLELSTTRGWIVFEDDEPSGFILCQVLPEQSEILTLCVRPARQRRGDGEALVKKAMQAAREKNSSLFLEVAADNIPAINLYEKLGFKESGRRAGYYKRGSSLVDAVLYMKA